MATFTMYDGYGRGFDMSAVTESGWEFVTVNPGLRTDVLWDNGSTILYNAYGAQGFNGFGLNYTLKGDDLRISDVGYGYINVNNGLNFTYTIEGLNFHVSVAQLQSGSSNWNVILNNGDDKFSGNNYADFIRGGIGNDGIVGYGGDDSLYGDAGNDAIDGMTGNDAIFGGAGNDFLSGEEGNDFIDGGSGYDVAIYSGSVSSYEIARNTDGSFSIEAFGTEGWDVLTNVETVQFGSLQYDLNMLAPATLSPVVTPPVVTPPPVLYIPPTYVPPASNLEPVSVIGTTGNDTIMLGIGAYAFRGMGNDTIMGMGGNDRLYGSSGNDWIAGGLGRDILSGGDGHNTFVFNTKPSKTNLDKITDYRVAEDSIYLENSIFKAVGKAGSLANPKLLKSSYFYSGTAAHDADDHVIFNKKTGALYYDPDGTGATAQVEIATLSKNLKMTYKDFFVV